MDATKLASVAITVPSASPTSNYEPEVRVTAENLTHLIDAELEQLRNEYKRPGWTPWALAGALAATLWLFSQEADRTHSNAWDIALAGFVFALITDAVRFLKMLVSTAPVPLSRGRRSHADSRLGRTRLGYVLSVGRAIAFWIVANHFQGPVANVAYFAALAMIVQSITLSALAFMFSLTRVPMDSNMRLTPKGRLFWAWILFLMVVSIVGYGGYYLQVAEPSSARMGGLLAAALVILEMMAISEQHSSLAPTLVSVRREMLLGRISISEAAKQVDIATAGMYLGDIFQNEIRSLLESLTDATEKMRSAEKLLLATETTLKQQNHRVRDEDQRVVLMGTVRAALTYSGAAIDICKKSQKSYDQLKSRVRKIAKVDKYCANQAEEIEEKLKSSFREILATARIIHSKLEYISPQLNLGNPASDSSSAVSKEDGVLKAINDFETALCK